MHLSEIVKNVNAELNTATNIDTLIKRWINKAQKIFLSMAMELEAHAFTWLTLNDLTLTTVVDQNEYALSPMVNISKMISLRDPDRKRTIQVITRHEFQERFPSPTDFSGDPECAYLSGFSPVSNQPTSSSLLSLVSSSSTDNSQVVKIEGLDSNGTLIGEEVTLTGLVPVSTSNSYARVLTRGINGFLAGTLTITSNGGAVTNAVVSPRSRQGLYPKIILQPVPSSVKTLYYDATMNLPDLVNDNDFSLIPEQYHDALEHYGLYRGFRLKKDYQAAGEAMSAMKGRVLEAIADDAGPEKMTVFCGEERSNYLGEGRFPGLWPKGY